VKTEISEVFHQVHQKPRHNEGCEEAGGRNVVRTAEFSQVEKGDDVELEVIAVAESHVEELTQSDVENKIKFLLERKQDIEQKIVSNKTGAGLESIEDE
jgi:hypothetical protein